MNLSGPSPTPFERDAIRAFQHGPEDATDSRSNSTAKPASKSASEPTPLSSRAYHGALGEFVRAIEPQTEADPAAILIQVLAAVGCYLGTDAYRVIESDCHPPRLYVAIVGDSAKSRKGTSWGHVRRALQAADPDWASAQVCHGLSTGEGLIHRVRDAKGEDDADVSIDKRLLVCEGELAKVLKVIERQGNTLSPILRAGWDSGDLQTLTKAEPMKATGAHISIIGHITLEELRKLLSETETANGFANRFLFVYAKRSKLLPRGGNVPQRVFEAFAKTLRDAAAFAANARDIDLSEDAWRMWDRVYPALSDARAGLAGAVTARGEAQVQRIGLIYALLDCSPVVKPAHLAAALEVWRYCEDSARFIFGDSLGDRLADEIHGLLSSKGAEGITRTAISEHFGRNRRAKALDRALEALLARGLARMERDANGPGRPSERWFAA